MEDHEAPQLEELVIETTDYCEMCDKIYKQTDLEDGLCSKCLVVFM